MVKALMLRARSRGFTIVELIVTIAVIGILTSIAVVAFNTIQTKTRDDVREADVAIIMDALEQYYRKNGDYPANDSLNPNGYPVMTDYTAVKTLLPGLTDSALSGPGGYKFYDPCINSGVCTNSSSDWYAYRTKSYFYLSRFSSQGAGTAAWANIPASYGNNMGWGCTVTTYYSNPGYVISWYSESKKIWIFKRSQYGQVTIASYDTGPVSPQTCAFS